MGYVYTLELEDECWYVGWTDQPQVRVAQHFLGRGALWTQLRKPIAVHSLIRSSDEQMEDVVTIALMAEKGWRQVRGGSWASPSLSSMPLPIARAFALNSSQLAGQVERRCGPTSYDYRSHALQIDGPPWRCRVTGPQAVLTSRRAVRSFKGTSEEEVRARAEAWLDSSAFN